MGTQADKIAVALREIAPDARLMQDEVPLINALGELWEKRAAPPPIAKPSGYILGARSLQRLAGVREEIVRVVALAITLTTQDFTVLEGVRSLADQRKAVAAGNSRTMKSKHLPQADGKAWAVDLAAWVNGAVSWEFNRYSAIAFAMDQAATKLGYAGHIRWGCAWDRVLADFGGKEADYMAEAAAYAKRHAGSDLLDGPHFEWVA